MAVDFEKLIRALAVMLVVFVLAALGFVAVAALALFHMLGAVP